MPVDDFIFSGESKRIIIQSGVTEVDVQDMYSSWKLWAQEGDNAKYHQAFRTFGGDPTIAGQFAPRYFFLTNGWRVFVEFGEVDFGVNLYTNELDPPIIVSDGSAASLRNSDAVNVETDISEALDYNGFVNINPGVGVTGTTYPVGTLARPVNNVAEAKVIADNYNFNKYRIFGTTIFNVDITNSVIIGGNISDVVVFQNVNVNGCTFKECVLAGSYSGYIAGEVVQLADGLSGASGVFKDSGLQGRIYLSDNANTSILNCSSMVPGLEAPSVFVNKNSHLSFRKYSGGINVYDCKSGSTASIELNAGTCNILSGNTGGLLVVAGIAGIKDESNGTEVNVDSLLVPLNVATRHQSNVITEVIKNKDVGN